MLTGLKIKNLLGLLLFCLVLTLSACEGEGKKEASSAVPSPSLEQVEPAAPKDPSLFLTLGSTEIFLPPPKGFSVLEPNTPLYRAVASTNSPGVILLRVLVRSELASGVLPEDGISSLEFILISTLSKWAEGSIAADDFASLKKSWEDKSQPLSSSVLAKFEQDMNNPSLLAIPKYVYNLGLLNSGENFFNLAFINKTKASAGTEDLYQYAVTGAYFADGKLLNLRYYKKLTSPEAVNSVCDESRTVLFALYGQNDNEAPLDGNTQPDG